MLLQCHWHMVTCHTMLSNQLYCKLYIPLTCYTSNGSRELFLFQAKSSNQHVLCKSWTRQIKLNISTPRSSLINIPFIALPVRSTHYQTRNNSYEALINNSMLNEIAIGPKRLCPTWFSHTSECIGYVHNIALFLSE